MTKSSASSDVRIPAEWEPQRAIWTAWPADAREWNGDLAAPRRDVAALVHALCPENRVRVLVNGAEAEASATEALPGSVELFPARYGDIWVRDTGPIFARSTSGGVALRFQTNSWGGKFDLPDDATVGDDMARHTRRPIRRFDVVLEGGALDHDGEGTVLTTRQTLLNTNRNEWDETDAEAFLRAALGVRKVIWIDQGLENDHTDGHVDNIARFIAPGRVVCQAPSGPDDPNTATLDAIATTLASATDTADRRLEVTRIPGVGRYVNPAGEVAPASYMNFVIANAIVVVPTYATTSTPDALNALQAAFPDRKVVGLPSIGLLGWGDAGGGSFHCITQQEPCL